MKISGESPKTVQFIHENKGFVLEIFSHTKMIVCPPSQNDCPFCHYGIQRRKRPLYSFGASPTKSLKTLLKVVMELKPDSSKIF